MYQMSSTKCFLITNLMVPKHFWGGCGKESHEGYITVSSNEQIYCSFEISTSICHTDLFLFTFVISFKPPNHLVRHDQQLSYPYSINTAPPSIIPPARKEFTTMPIAALPLSVAAAADELAVVDPLLPADADAELPDAGSAPNLPPWMVGGVWVLPTLFAAD